MITFRQWLLNHSNQSGVSVRTHLTAIGERITELENKPPEIVEVEVIKTEYVVTDQVTKDLPIPEIGNPLTVNHEVGIN